MGLERPVALKVLGIHAAPDSSARRRFLNEARTAAALHHTHIVPVFDVGQVGGLCYYAMQRIEGSGLDWVVRHLRRSRPAVAGGRWRPGERPVPDHDPSGCSAGRRRSTPGSGISGSAWPRDGCRRQDRRRRARQRHRRRAGDRIVARGGRRAASITGPFTPCSRRAGRFDGLVG